MTDPICLYYLTHSHTTTIFDTRGKQAFSKKLGKREIARNEQFLVFPVFPTY